MSASQDIFLTCGLVRCKPERLRIDDIAFPTSVHCFEQTYRNAKMGLVAPVQRLIDDILGEAISVLKPESFAEDSARRATLLAAGNNNFVGVQARKLKPGGWLDYESRNRTLQTTQVYAGKAAQMLRSTGHISADASACASSMKALMDAIHLIKLHELESVAIISAEDQISLSVLEFFGDMGICLNQKQLDEGMQPSAFDGKNQGFLIAQGATFAWLETEQSMRQGQRAPIAKLLAAVTAGETFNNPFGQAAAGQGYERAIKWALRQAGLAPAQIDLIKTHGTGTPLNNQVEAAALRAVFGPRFRATGYKPTIGHTFGASGLLESILAIEDARAGLARGIAHRTAHDEVFLSHDIEMPIKYILALSAGMGNVYGAAIWEVMK